MWESFISYETASANIRLVDFVRIFGISAIKRRVRIWKNQVIKVIHKLQLNFTSKNERYVLNFNII